MGILLQDVRYALRLLLKSPGFTLAAILTLGLGIGANAAIFSVANAFLRKPIWFPAIESLVVVANVPPGEGRDRNSVSPGDYVDWKAQSKSFEEVGAYEWSDVNLTGSGDPQKLNGANVSANFFHILGIQPQLGRAFLPEEEQLGHEHEVILGHGLWERRFGADPAIIGKPVTLDGLSYSVVGVAGNDFDFPTSAQYWLPLTMTDKEKTLRGDHYVWPVARLRPGVSIEQAQAEMATIAGHLQADFPQTEKGWNVRVIPMRHFASDEYSRQYSVLLLYAVGFVLLIACANVANVQLARAAARQREFAMREAIGASRWRIIRQLLTESTLLSVAGAGLGLIFAQWSIDLMVTHMPPDVARYIAAWKHIKLDADVLAYTTVLALAAGIVSGLAPAFQGAKIDLGEQLKEGGRGTTAGKSRHFLRNAFVVGEVAASLLLLVGAGLMVKGVRSLLATHKNMTPEAVLTMRVQLPDSKYKEPRQRSAFYERVLDQLNAIPGAKVPAVATRLPFADSGVTGDLSIEGIPAQPGEARFINSESVNPDYFRAMNIPLREGRFFTAQDGADAPRVAVISQRLAQRFWPNQSPLGKHVRDGAENSAAPWATIVGVAGEVRYDWNEGEDFPTLYFPYKQFLRQFSYIAMRTDGDPLASVSAARAAIATVDPDQPIYEIKTMAQMISEAVVGLSYVAWIMAVLGAMALVLAAVGVYGVMAYAVTERTHEIGVRLALGAQPSEILRLILSRGVFLTGLGMLIGLPVSFALANLMASLIYGVQATDPPIFFGVTFFLAAVALAACYIPARRAMCVDPIVALRYE
ncbi:MAG: ABC transporter permease [Candidatus Acidiferrales bacterium]